MIIFLTYYNYPCNEPALENIFAKELGKKFDITWLFQGYHKNNRILNWHNSKIILTKKHRGSNRAIRVINKILALEKYFQLAKFLFKGRVDTIVIRDMPFIFILIRPLKAFLKFRIYFQHTAPLGDIDIGYYKIQKSKFRYWYRIKGWCYNFLIKIVMDKADIVFPISEFHKRELIRFHDPDKFVPITMGIDEEWINRKKEELGDIKRLKQAFFILIYFGSLSFVRNPKFILEVFYFVSAKLKKCKLFLVGNIDHFRDKLDLMRICEEMKISENVLFIPRLSRNNLQNHLQYCDLSISAIPPEGFYRISSPTKVYESLGNGIPVVGNKEIYEQEKVILNSNGGVVTDYDPKSFAEAIIMLLKNKNLREKMAKSGKDYVIKNYNYRLIAERIHPYFI